MVLQKNRVEDNPTNLLIKLCNDKAQVRPLFELDEYHQV